MPQEYFLDPTNDGKAEGFERFRDSISPYVSLFGLSAADITQQAVDAGVFRVLVNFAKAKRDEAAAWKAWRDFMRDGAKTGHPTPPTPTAVPVPAVLTSGTPLAGIVPRFLLLAGATKKHRNYTSAVGQVLGIEGAVRTGPDRAEFKPAISVKVEGDHVAIKWGWHGFSAFLDMLEIEVDRGAGGGWVLLTFDTTPNFTDPTPLPAVAARW